MKVTISPVKNDTIPNIMAYSPYHLLFICKTSLLLIFADRKAPFIPKVRLLQFLCAKWNHSINEFFNKTSFHRALT